MSPFQLVIVYVTICFTAIVPNQAQTTEETDDETTLATEPDETTLTEQVDPGNRGIILSIISYCIGPMSLTLIVCYLWMCTYLCCRKKKKRKCKKRVVVDVCSDSSSTQR